MFASNSSLCGGFNANVIRHLNEVVAEYEPKVGRENILIYPVGRKVADAVKKMEGLTAAGDYQHMSGKPNYQEAADPAAELMTRFASGEIQQVELLYNHSSRPLRRYWRGRLICRSTWVPVMDEKGRGAGSHAGRLPHRTVAGTGDGGVAAQGAPHEDVHRAAWLHGFRNMPRAPWLCRLPRTMQTTWFRNWPDLQQEPPAGDYQRVAGHRGRQHELTLRAELCVHCIKNVSLSHGRIRFFWTNKLKN